MKDGEFKNDEGELVITIFTRHECYLVENNLTIYLVTFGMENSRTTERGGEERLNYSFQKARV